MSEQQSLNKDQVFTKRPDSSYIEISATIITYNEEHNIARCIESLLPVIKDIIIVDSYSTDNTEAICKKYPVTFIKNKFEGHIQQKNYAITLAKNDVILNLDADEAIDDELQKSIIALKSNFKKDGYLIQRYNNYCGQWINHSDWNPDKKLRIFHKTKAHWGGINPHDHIIMDPGASIGVLPGQILHWVHRNHEEHRIKTEKFSTIASKEYYKLGRTSSYLDIIVRPLWIFTRSYIFRMGFLDGKNGFILCTFSAKTTYLKYLKLRRLIKQNKIDRS